MKGVVAVAFLCALTISTTLAGEPQVPVALATPAGDRLASLIRFLNSRSPAALFVSQTFDAAEKDPAFAASQSAALEALRAQTGGLVVKQVERSESASIQALAQAKRTQAWYRLSMFITAEPPNFSKAAAPFKVVAFGLHGIAAPAGLGEHGLGDAQVRTRMDQLMMTLAESDYFSGVVQVQRSGRTIFAKAYGLADRERRSANQLSTRFNLASITKMFTAVAVGQLVDAGKLKFEDRVSAVMPELVSSGFSADGITIHQLLSHTSGMIGAREAHEKGFEPPREARSIEEMVRTVLKAPLSTPSGQQYGYSNAGYVLLGAIIERISGQGYHEYVAEQVFRRAGMQSTGFYALGSQPNISVGYKDAPNGGRLSNHQDIPLIGSPANMAFSTASDMMRFYEALRDGKLLSKDTRDRLWTGVTEQSYECEYGYGAHIEHYNGHRIIGHGGGAPGVTNRFEFFPDDAAAVVVLSNYDTEPTIITNKLREWLTPPPAASQSVEPRPPAIEVSVKPLSRSLTVGNEVAFELLARNTGGTAHATVVDLEIFDANGQKVDQRFTSGQKLPGSATRTFTFKWIPKKTGVYRIDGAVFGPAWMSKLQYVERAAEVEVR